MFKETSDKGGYAEKQPPVASQTEFFEKTFESFFETIAPKRLFLPPPKVVRKYGFRAYNDGGETKKDTPLVDMSIINRV